MEEASLTATSGVSQTVALPRRAPGPSDPVPLLPDYAFIKVIGRGAFGTVWLAEERLSGVFRAIKVLRLRREKTPAPEGTSETHAPPCTSEAHAHECASRVDRELAGIHAYQVLAKDHPHLIRILKTGICTLSEPEADAERRGGGPPGSRDAEKPSRPRHAVYYVMEIADHAGGAQPHHPLDYQPLTLATLLRQRGRLPTTARSLVRESLVRGSLVRESLLAPSTTPLGVVECAGALLDAIDHLHKAGLHHRDIKPSNVLFVHGVLKLGDLGLAASDNDEPVGTPGYLPPAPDHGLPCPPDGSRFGPPDDLYAFGKVMYELTTGLPAASFPEWPADLDPAADPLLPRLRELINDLCHPSAERRLSSPAKDGLRTIRRRLASIQSGPPMLHTTRRRAKVALATIAAIALALGIGADRFWAWWTDPFRQHLATWPYDGGEVTQKAILGAIEIELIRGHLPGQTLSFQTDSRWRLIRFADIQTRLIEDELAVAGCYQIVSTMNPVTGSVLDPRGEVNQLLLVLTDGKNAEVRFLYHGQPGPAPGARGRFCERFPLTSPDWLRPGAGCWVLLAYMAETTPEKAREGFEKRGPDENHTVKVAEIRIRQIQAD